MWEKNKNVYKVNKSVKKVYKKTQEETEKTIKYYQTKLIDNYGFISTSLSNLIDNLSEKLHENNILSVNIFLHIKKLMICTLQSNSKKPLKL